MIIEGNNKEKITISFSGKVGKQGLNRIKNFVEFLEKSTPTKQKKISIRTINKLAEEINESAWKKFKKARKIK